MGTSAARSSSNTEYFTRGDKIPGLQVCSLPLLCLYLTRLTRLSIIGQRNGYHCNKTCRRIRQEMGSWRRQRSTSTWIRYIPLWRALVRFSFLFSSWFNYVITRMSDPGTTYRTREEVQRMRSTQDPIRGLQKNIEEWEVATEQELKVLVFSLSRLLLIRSYFSFLVATWQRG